MRNTPFIMGAFLLAIALAGGALLLSGGAIGGLPDGLTFLMGGLGTGMLLVLGLVGWRWSRGERTFSASSKKDSKGRAKASRKACRNSCFGLMAALVAFALGIAALYYFLRILI